MTETKAKTSPYRWVVLSVYILITVIIEIQWLAFASISSVAQDYYQSTALGIDFLSMVYMLVFLVMSIPASFVLDTYGLRKGLIVGAVLTGVFGVLKAMAAENLLMVTIAQTGLAFAQPFILNAVTKMGAKWFPVQERATVAGLGSLAQYLGIIIALALTPVIINEQAAEGYGIPRMLWIYGILSVAGAVTVLVFMKEEPDVSPSGDKFSTRIHPLEGIKVIFKNRDMQWLLVLFFIGLGIFNAVSTCIDQICDGLSVEETGMVGGVMLVGGVVGAVILPFMSDQRRKRKPFIVLCMVMMLPGLLGLTFFSSFVPMLISAFVFGFFIMSAGPIGFQYGAEVSNPVPESTSQGLILLTGQISGILFVFGVNAVGILIMMIGFLVLTVVNIGISTRLKESMQRFLV